MLNSDFDLPIIEERPARFPEVGRAVPGPTPIYDVVPGVGEVNGARLLKATRYNFELAGAIIATRRNWQEILASIESPELIANTRAIAIMVRESLGLPVD
jgi:hypothetical protein